MTPAPPGPASPLPRPATGAPPRWAQAALVLGACLLAYANVFECDFIWDDVPAIRENAVLASPSGIPALFRTPYWDADMGVGLYRPVLMTTFALERRLFGRAPAGYHLANAAWHAAAALALLALFWRMLGPGLAALAGALVFAVHPVHAEAVTGLVGRADVLAALCALLALLAYEQARGARRGVVAWACASAAALAVGFLGKESAVVTPGLAVLLEWHQRRRAGPAAESPPPPLRVAGLLAAQVAAVAAILVLRRAILGNAPPAYTVFALAGTDALGRVLVACEVLADYVRMQVLPVGLVGSYTVNTRLASLHVPPGDLAAWAAVTAVAGLGLAAWAARKRIPWFTVGVGWFFVALAPVSNLLLPIGVIKAERFLYLPSAGAALVLGVALAAAVGRLRAPGGPAWRSLAGAALLPLVVVAGTSATLVRNWAWSGPEAFWQDVRRKQPDDPQARVGLGFLRLEEGEAAQLAGRPEEAAASLAEALADFRAASAENPHFEQAGVFESEALWVLGRQAAALGALVRAFEPPAASGAQAVSGMAHLAAGRTDAARRDFLLALLRLPRAARPLNHLVWLARMQGRPGEALDCAEVVTTIRADLASGWFNRGAALTDSGHAAEAIGVLDRLLELDPDHAGGLYYRGLATLRGGGAPGAAARDLKRALELDADLPAAYAALAEALRLGGDAAGSAAAAAEAQRRAGGTVRPGQEEH